MDAKDTAQNSNSGEGNTYLGFFSRRTLISAGIYIGIAKGLPAGVEQQHNLI